MRKLFTKKQFFAFLASLFITLVAGFFVFGLFLGSNNYIYVFNKVLGQASLPVSDDVNIIFEEEPEKNNIVSNTIGEEIFEKETPVIIVHEITEQERQDLLDDIAEKLDIIQQKVNELVAESNPDKEQKIEEENEEEIDEEESEENKDEQDILEKEKVEENKNGGLINYPTILISEVQIGIENRFIKLYNPTDQNVALTDWYLQRKTETSDTWSSCVSSTKFEGKIIFAQSYFLISKTNPLADIFDEDLTITENNSLILKNPSRQISDEFFTVAPPATIVSGGGENSEEAEPALKNILISEIQIGSQFDEKQEFIELYNPNNSSVDLTNWYLQRKTSGSSSWGSYAPKSLFLNKTITAKGYFLIARNGYFTELGDIFTNYAITNSNFFVFKNSDQEVSDELNLIGQNPDNDRSLCRLDFSTNDWEICVPTPGAENQKYVETPANDSGDYFLGSEDYFAN